MPAERSHQSSCRSVPRLYLTAERVRLAAYSDRFYRAVFRPRRKRSKRSAAGERHD